MSLTQDSLKSLLAIAIEAARDAGVIITNARGSKTEAQKIKSGDSLSTQVVTQTDIEAQEAILKKLSPTFGEYDLGLLTEESADDHSRFEKDFFWCIDPLDGTLNFSQGIEGYSTSIALVSREGESILGIVFDPINDNLYYAQKNSGAFKNESSFALSSSREYQQETLLISDGPAVMNAIKTLESPPAIFYKKPKEPLGGGSLWDYAATSVIHREAGGFHGDFEGNPLNLNKKGSTFMNDCGVFFASDSSLFSHKKNL